jgi:hypothetical protein
VIAALMVAVTVGVDDIGKGRRFHPQPRETRQDEPFDVAGTACVQQDGFPFADQQRQEKGPTAHLTL